jgi:hypothetical protein
MSNLLRHGKLPVRTRINALALVAIAALVVVSAAMAATSRSAVKPSNNTPPTISGDTSVGSTLTANPGTWDGSSPLTFQYQWLVCDGNGGACGNISGETDKTYKVRTADQGNTIKVRVIASNSEGSDTATSAASAKVTAATSTTPATTTTTATPAANGCPKTTSASQAVSVTDVSAPARLLVTQFQANPSVITRSLSDFTVRFHVGNTCGQAVQGAQVYATAVPFGQVSIPGQQQTDANGDVTLQFHKLAGFPAARNQRLLVVFVRASKPGDPVLAGISTRRLISLRVNLNG